MFANFDKTRDACRATVTCRNNTIEKTIRSKFDTTGNWEIEEAEEEKVANRTGRDVEIDGHLRERVRWPRSSVAYSCMRNEKRSPFPYDGPSMTVACNQ